MDNVAVWCIEMRYNYEQCGRLLSWKWCDKVSNKASYILSGNKVQTTWYLKFTKIKFNIGNAFSFLKVIASLESRSLQKSSPHDDKFVFTLWTDCEENCWKCLVKFIYEYFWLMRIFYNPFKVSVMYFCMTTHTIWLFNIPFSVRFREFSFYMTKFCVNSKNLLCPFQCHGINLNGRVALKNNKYIKMSAKYYRVS